MKNKIITSVLLAASISFSGNMSAQELFRADFETYETTPYFFRADALNNLLLYMYFSYCYLIEY